MAFADCLQTIASWLTSHGRRNRQTPAERRLQSLKEQLKQLEKSIAGHAREAEAVRALGQTFTDPWQKARAQMALNDVEYLRKRLVSQQRRLQASLGGLTLRELAECPFTQLHIGASPRQEDDQDTADIQRTFGRLERWDGYEEGATQLLDQLDNTKRCWKMPSAGDRMEDSLYNAWPLPTKRVVVKERVIPMTECINKMAEALGLGAVVIDGTGRSGTSADLVIRPVGAVSNNTDLSKFVLGVGAVRCNQDFELERGERLEDALQDPERAPVIAKAIQEVYADALATEAPMMFLTNRDVTVFMHRSPDVLDNTIWVSAPVWWDQCPRVAWLYALQQAAQLRSRKQILPRLLVPRSGACHRITLRKQEAAQQQQLAAGGHQGAMIASRKRQRPAEQHTLSLASSARRKRPRTAEQHPDQPNASACNMPQRSRQSLQMQGSSNEGHEEGGQPFPMAWEAEQADLDEEDILPLSALGEEIVELWEGDCGYTLKGCYDGRTAMIKVYDLKKHGAAEAFATEKQAYKELEALQGTAIPKLLCSGVMDHTWTPVTVTTLHGSRLEDTRKPVPKYLHSPMRAALQAIHDQGATHGDIRSCNFMRMGDTVQMVNLNETILRASKADRAAEMLRLNIMLR